LLRLQATATPDPHYQLIVDDFRAFGSDTFRSKVNAARAEIQAAK
jgi:hypothetical protein